VDRRFDKARGKSRELPYWSRAESRNSKGKILKSTKRTGDDNLYETCVAISGQAVIYIVGSLHRVLRMRSDR
jgi:hypothetical protein